LTDAVELVLTDQPPDSLRDLIGGGILAANEAALGPSDRLLLAILIRDKEKVVGGLLGRTSYKRLFVELLFVPEYMRGQRMGEKVLRRAEDEAKKRGCIGAWLETLSADAKRFYVRNGYRVFGEIAHYPPGNTRYFVAKDFGQAADS
jgi:ribosomal protein S18 acetylase RimI-like enzyme